jgi:hypothetical protein
MDLRYPIGPFRYDEPLADEARQRLIDQIEAAPARVRAAVEGLSPQQLDTPYRPGGWTVRQVAHHLPDSHLNGYIRFRLALTEDEPTIKPYHEDRWAALSDARQAPIESSLALLEALHQLGLAVESAHGAGLDADIHPPRVGHRESRHARQHLRLAWTSSCSAYHLTQGTHGMGDVSGARHAER